MGVLLVVMFIVFVAIGVPIFYRYRISGTDSEFSCIPENV